MEKNPIDELEINLHSAEELDKKYSLQGVKINNTEADKSIFNDIWPEDRDKCDVRIKDLI